MARLKKLKLATSTGALALAGGATTWLAVGNGFAQIDGDAVRVLAEHAITEEKIDEHAVEAAMKLIKKQPVERFVNVPFELVTPQNLSQYAGKN